MTNLVENSSWDAGVLQFATTDPIQGGPGGIDNQPHQSLADRSLWLRNRIGAAITQAGLTEGTVDNQQLAEAVVLQCASAVVLRSLPVPVVPNTQTVLVMTRGQASDGDGFGAVYKWVFNSTLADNGSTVLDPTGLGSGAGRWIASGLNSASLGGQPASFYVTAQQVAAQFETIPNAAANLTAAENFANSVASTAQTNAENFAASAAATAQNNAESFASSVANAAQTAAQSFASTAATNAQNAAIASSEAFTTTAVNNAVATSEAFASNGSNINAGTVAAAHLPLIGNLSGVVIQADPGGTPSGFPPGTMVFYF